MAIKIGEQEFKSKVAAKNHIRELMKDFDPSNSIWMDLLLRHPNRAEKIGAGVKAFFLSLNPVNGQSHQLNIRRLDGSIEHFSWLKCIDGYNRSPKAMLLSAMRLAVSPQTQAFKDKSGIKCEICEKEERSRVLRHVDHFPLSFQELSNNFLASETDLPVDFADCPKSNAAMFKYDDKEFAARWVSYHLEHARYRMLCVSCNTTRPKK